MGRQYFEPLTWLRAIAAFFVVISHSIRTSEVQYAAADVPSYFFPLSMLDLGTFGVYLFFALSGCTLYISNHRKIDGLGDFWGFYVKRFMRIWPAFAVSLLAYLVFIEVFRHYYISDKTLWIARFLTDYSIANIFQYLSLTFNITGPQDLFAGPYWSLPVEFQYYLLLPPALLLMKVKRFELLTPVFFACVLYVLYKESLFQIDRDEVFKMGFTFFGGVLIANFHQGVSYRVPFSIAIAVFALFVLFVGLVRTDIISISEHIPFIWDKWNLYGLVALLSVLLALFSRPPANTNRLLRFVHRYGEISYSIYLFHMLFVGTAALLVVNFGIYGDSPKLFFVLSFSLVSSYLFSIYTYRYIELPSIRLGRKLSKDRKANIADAEMQRS
jgi:peptidoglycan/LPS O-acetylase OafA/YrhL